MNDKQQQVSELYARRGWRPEKPQAQVARLVTDTARVATVLSNPSAAGVVRERELATAIGGALFALIAIANSRGIDIDVAFESAMKNVDPKAA